MVGEGGSVTRKGQLKEIFVVTEQLCNLTAWLCGPQRNKRL